MIDKKLNYLVKTLSRTKRKDYENYVINAIWNRINDNRLMPVSQQLVRNGKNHYFIDLYFPQINVGVECDEGHHKKQLSLDEERELTIFDILKQIKSTDYKALHIDVTKSFEEVEEQINDHVLTIKNKIKELGDNLGFNMSNEEKIVNKQLEGKTVLSVKDDIAFSTIVEVFNSVLGKNYKGFQRGYVHFQGNQYAWFPKLAIDGKSVVRGWNNVLDKDGTIIYEFNEDNEELNVKHKEENKYVGEERIVFTQTKNPITANREYRFAGIFKCTGYDENNHTIYEKISDEVKIY